MTNQEKIQYILHCLKSEAPETVKRLANELLSDAGKPLVRTKEGALTFFKEWLPTIDDKWLNQIYKTNKLAGTFSDPFCNSGGGR